MEKAETEDRAVTWILVADGYRGRIFANEGPGKGIRPAQDQDLSTGAVTPALRAANQVSNGSIPVASASKTSRGKGFGTSHQQSFARSVATVLERGLDQKRYDRLVIVAPPQALGDLRGALPCAVRNCVTSEISRDLTHASCYELPKYLGPSIAG